MLVLVSFGLVLLATILLVVGLLTDDGLNLIYLSITCSFVAAVVLYAAFRRAKPKADVAGEPPAPLLPEGHEPERGAAMASPAPAVRSEDPTTVQPAVVPAEAHDVEADPELADVNPGATPTADLEPAGAPVGDDWVDDDDWADAGEFDVEFPIADYDDLTVGEIMPLLPQLYSDELEIVAERERAGKNRTTILRRLEELAATGTEADATDADLGPEDADDLADGADEPFAPEPAPARPAPQVPSLRDEDEDWDDDDLFPIADYDELTADQIIPLLSQLEDDELEDVKAREVSGQGRKSVITEIDRQLGLVGALDDADEADGAWQPEEPARAPRAAPRAEAAEGSTLAIAGYDGLTVAEIRPLLSGLSPAELQAVLDHEVARDNRRTIVADIERRLESTDVAPAPARRPARKAASSRPARTAAPAKRATASRSATKKAAPAKRANAKKAAKKASATRFPIAGYDNLSVAEIRPRLGDLSDRQLQLVRDRELAGAGRKTILAEIDRRLG